MSSIFGILYFPQFDPVALHLGPIAIRWYSLSYIVGILLGWWLALRLIRYYPDRWRIKREDFDDLVPWLIVGIIVGGRLGQVFLWSPGYFLSRPWEIFYIWKGGMAFHGGLLGVILAMLLFAHRRKMAFFDFADLIVICAPIGLFLGRIANFINGELWGRPTDGSWGVIFPDVDNVPRHPSQLYEAALEGLVLFLIMQIAVRTKTCREKAGRLTGLFLFFYAIARSIAEIFREPEVDLGRFGFITWGQVLSLPMAIFGLYLILRRWGTRPLVKPSQKERP